MTTREGSPPECERVASFARGEAHPQGNTSSHRSCPEHLAPVVGMASRLFSLHAPTALHSRKGRVHASTTGLREHSPARWVFAATDADADAVASEKPTEQTEDQARELAGTDAATAKQTI